jgi:hypothetical protein
MNTREFRISIPLACTFIAFSLSVTYGDDLPAFAVLRNGIQGVRDGQNVLFHASTSNLLRGITSHWDSSGWFLRGPAMAETTMRLRLLDINGRSATSTAEAHILEYVLEAKQDETKVAEDSESIQLGVLLVGINRTTGKFVTSQWFPKINLDHRIPIDCGFGGGQAVEAGQYLACVLILGLERDESPVQFLGARFKRVFVAGR